MSLKLTNDVKTTSACQDAFDTMAAAITALVDSVQQERMDLHIRWITRLLEDTKKHIMYDKHMGTWSWVDRDGVDSLENYHNGFETWLLAAEAAVEPYLSEE